MRIAYLINRYPSPSHSFIRREIRALERQGIKVHRFALRGDRSALVDAADIAEHERTEHVLLRGGRRLLAAGLAATLRSPRAGLAAVRLAARLARRSDRGLALHLVYLLEAAYVARRCGEMGVEHLHAHFGTNSATVAMLAATLGGLTWSFTVHGPEEFDKPDQLALDEKMRRAAFTVAVSSFGRSQLYRWIGRDAWARIHVVHCGIEPERFAGAAAPPAGRAGLVTIGRLVEQKGQLLLLEALSDAVATHPSLHLTLVGDGTMRAEIEAMVHARGLQPHVTLAGWVDEERVRHELAQAQALVMPSFAEGLPMVVMEAMAAGRAVIATYVAGMPELVRPGETGWLVPAGDVAALAEAMRTVAKTPPEVLAAMGCAGRSRVLQRHDIDREAAKLSKHFVEAVRGGRAMPSSLQSIEAALPTSVLADARGDIY